MKEIRLTPRAIKAKETKQRLYDNAMRMFAKHGYKNITIDDICRETGVSKGAFYNHFPTKSSVLLYAFNSLEANYTDFLQNMEKGLSAKEKLLAFCEKIITETTKDPASLIIARIIYSEEPLGVCCLFRPERVVFSGLKSLVEEGVGSGELKPELDAEKTANVLFCQCIGNLMRILSLESSVELEKLISEAIYGLDILCGSLQKTQ